MRNTIPHHSKKFEPIPTVRSPSATRALQQVLDLDEFANSTRESVFGTNFVDSQDRRRATPPRQLRPSRDSAASTPSTASTLSCRLRATPPRQLRPPRRLISTTTLTDYAYGVASTSSTMLTRSHPRRRLLHVDTLCQFRIGRRTCSIPQIRFLPTCTLYGLLS